MTTFTTHSSRVIDLGDKAKPRDVVIVRMIVALGFIVTTDPTEQPTPRHKVSIYDPASGPQKMGDVVVPGTYVCGMHEPRTEYWDSALRYVLSRLPK